MLKGTLDDFTLPDIFRLLSMAKRTGTLDVARSAGQGRVFFRDGDVYFAESSLTREPLGQKLIRARAVTEGQLMKALDEHAANGGRVGEILVAAGALTAEQLESAVKGQIEDSVFDLLRWELGEFEWAPGDEIEVEVPIAVSVENLIMEASRRLDELAVIKRKIPSVETVLRMAPTPPEGAVEINITPEEWRILVLVDGARDVAAIAEAVSLDEFGAMRVLYGLVSAGLIELAPGSPAPARTPASEVAHELPSSSAAIEDQAFAAEDEAPAEDVAPPAPMGVDLSPASDPADADEELLVAPSDAADPDLDELEAEALVAAEDGAAPAFLDGAPAFSIETFDAPAEDELVAEAPAETNGAGAELDELATEPSIDRADAVRELAGLFSDNDRPRPQRAAAGDGPPRPQRLEDDDQLTKGLISRLIDGVKGL